jgi:hypothetical protein
MWRGSLMVMAAAGMLLAGCTTERQIVQNKEDMLAASGFTIRPANTPERQAEMKNLPPHKFVYQERNGKPVYLYADPTVCDCLYIGSEQAYQQYHKLALQKQIADEQLQAAQMSMSNWNWGPWGPGWWW